MNVSAKVAVLIALITVASAFVVTVSWDTEGTTETVELDDQASLSETIGSADYQGDDLIINLKEGCTYSITGVGFQGDSLTINGNGATVEIITDNNGTGPSAWVSSSTRGTVDVNDVRFVVSDDVTSTTSCILYFAYFSEATVTRCTFEKAQLGLTTSASDAYPDMDVTVTDCTWSMPEGESPYSGQYAVLLAILHDVTVSNCSVTGYDRGMNIELRGEDGSADVDGVEFSGIDGKCAIQFSGGVGYGNVRYSGCTFENCATAVSIHEGATGEGSIVSLGNTYSGCDVMVLYSYGTATSKVGLVSAGDEFNGCTTNVEVENDGSGAPISEVPVANWYTPGSMMTISTEEELRQFAALVNSGIDFDGETVELEGDIEISGEWTPIGQGTRDGSGYTDYSTPFRGTFDGRGHSISGLEIKTTSGADYALGLFGIVAGGTVKDLTLLDVEIDCSDSEMAGAVVGMLCEDGTVSGCTVGDESDDTSKISAGRGNGGIVGRMTLSGTIEDCTNYATITGTSAGGNTGGIVGAAYYNNEGMTISGCHNYGSVSATTGVGGIVGLTSATMSDCHNHGDITGNGTSIGGIAGEARGGTTIKDCTNDGAVSNGNTSTEKEEGYGTGGIVGWIRYIDQDVYGDNAAVSVSGNTNNGNVSSGSVGAGGIVGMLYHSATVDGNTSTGDISGNEMVGGIVGGVQTTDTYHSGGTCHIRITDNTSSGTLTNSGSNTGSIVGHLTTLGSEYGCTLLHGSYVTNYGNTSTATGTDTNGFQQVGMLFSTVIDGVTYGYQDLDSALENCSEVSTITVLGDVELSTGVTIPDSKDVTLSMGSFSITGARCNEPLITNNGTLRIADGTIRNVSDNDTANDPSIAILNHGTLLIDGGTFESGNANCICNYGDATINGGSFNNTGNPCIRNYGDMEIHGGTFHNSSCAYEVYGYTISCNNANDDGSATSPTLIIDETVGDVVVTGTRGALGVSDGYAEIRGGSFTVLENNCGTPSHTTTHYAIYCAGERGSVDMRVYGGEFTSYNNVCVQVGNSADGGKELPAALSIYGGSFKISNNDDAAIVRNDMATENVPSVEIYGGTFDRTVDASLIATGYEQGSDGSIVLSSDAKMAASIDGIYYSTLEKAIVASQDGDTIVLLSDVSETVTFDRDIELALNLGEFTLSADAGCPLTVTAGTLTIDASTGGITGTSAAVVIENGATVNIMGGELTSNGYTVQVRGDGSHVEIGGSASITGPAGVAIYGGSLSMSGGSIDATVYGISGNGTYDGTTIVISGGDIASDGNAIYHPQEGNITISGGNISGITGLWYSGAGEITISGGTIASYDEKDRTDPWKPAEQNDGTSYDGAALSIVTRGTGYQDGGKTIEVVITGGTLESAANYALRDYRFAKSGGEWQTNDNSGINDSALASISISCDARFISPTGHAVLDVDSASSERYSITGGSFTSDVSAYLADGYVLFSNPDGTYGVTPEGDTVTVTFVVDGTSTQVVIPKGGTVPSAFVPDLPEAPEHYGYIWSGDVGSVFYENATITAELIISDLEVTVRIDGDSATAVIETPVDYVNAAYSWFYGVDGGDPDMFGSTETVTLGDDGRYGLLVVIENADGVYGLATCEFDYVAESDLPPFIPFPPEQGGDPVEVYPSGDSGSSDGGDDSMKIVTVAAAAVIAAILAIVLASTYRRN